VLASGRRCARGVIIAAGVVYRRLEAPRIDGLLSRGVQDGSAPGEAEMYRGRRVTIVGPANSAGQAAIHADKGAHVTLLCRGAALDRSMLRYLVERNKQYERSSIRTRTVSSPPRRRHRHECLLHKRTAA
jgi:thioredoxin reductase